MLLFKNQELAVCTISYVHAPRAGSALSAAIETNV